VVRTPKEPTATTLVLTALRAVDDFMDRRMLRVALPGVKHDQIGAALIHLRKHHAVDVVIEHDGVGWWYAAAPANDNRSRVVDLRTPETRPRHYRRQKPTKQIT
jgi:hypothetical protein